MGVLKIKTEEEQTGKGTNRKYRNGKRVFKSDTKGKDTKRKGNKGK